MTYTRARSLLAGIVLTGSAISQDQAETSIRVGKIISLQEILTGRVAPPAGSEPFLAAVRQYSFQSKDQAANTNQR